MKKFTSYLILAFFAITLSCSKDDGPNQKAAFEDLGDFVTESLETNIPRLQIALNGKTITSYLSVTDQNGKPLENFTIGNYSVEIEANNQVEFIEQNRIQLSILENTSEPLAAACTMDYSGSMSSQNVADMENALETFVNIKEPNDEIAIIKFASDHNLIQNFTSDSQQLLDAIASNYPSGNTDFYDSCSLGLDVLENKANFVPVVIGFTDGNDNQPGISLSNLKDKSNALSVPIYTVGFGGIDTFVMSSLAQETGGRFFPAPSSEDIVDLYVTISNQLRKLYELSFDVDYSSGTQIIVRITTEYTAGNGSFTDTAERIFILE